MSHRTEGKAPNESSTREREYLLKKLSEVRKDCQWLLGLAAASVLGVVLKDNFGISMPRLRMTTLVISSIQVFVSMIGAVSWFEALIDPANEVAFLTRRLRRRYVLRNAAIFLLAVSFILIAVMGWNVSMPSK
ncbi:MAG: hypothetical protein QOD75_3353 [Blastocatellia bacterium]|jgi:hypothetical protein|nr:hypothetical protein [Blastocatellia bacterium]